MHTTAKKPLNERGIGPLDRLIKPYRPARSPVGSSRVSIPLISKPTTPFLPRNTTFPSHSQSFYPTTADKGKARAINPDDSIIVIDSDEESGQPATITAPRKIVPSHAHDEPSKAPRVAPSPSSRSRFPTSSAISNHPAASSSTLISPRLAVPNRPPQPFPLDLPSPSPERGSASSNHSSERFDKHNPFMKRSTLHAHSPRTGERDTKPFLPQRSAPSSSTYSYLRQQCGDRKTSGTKAQPIDLISNSTASSGVAPVGPSRKQAQPSIPKPTLDRMRDETKRGGFGAHGRRASPVPGSREELASRNVVGLEKGKGKERDDAGSGENRSREREHERERDRVVGGSVSKQAENEGYDRRSRQGQSRERIDRNAGVRIDDKFAGLRQPSTEKSGDKERTKIRRAVVQRDREPDEVRRLGVSNTGRDGIKEGDQSRRRGDRRREVPWIDEGEASNARSKEGHHTARSTEEPTATMRTSNLAPSTLSSGSRPPTSSPQPADVGRISQRFPLPSRPEGRVKDGQLPTRDRQDPMSRSRPDLEAPPSRTTSRPVTHTGSAAPAIDWQAAKSAISATHAASVSSMKRPATSSSTADPVPVKKIKLNHIPPSLDEESYRPAVPKYPVKAASKPKRASTTLATSTIPSRPARARPAPGKYTIPPMDTPMREWPNHSGTYGDAVKKGIRSSATTGVGPTKKDVKAAVDVKRSADVAGNDQTAASTTKEGQGRGAANVTTEGHWFASSLTPLSSRGSLASISSPVKVQLGSLAEIDDGADYQMEDAMGGGDQYDGPPTPAVTVGIPTSPAEVLNEKEQNLVVPPTPPKAQAKRSSQVSIPSISKITAFQSQAELQALRKNAASAPKKAKTTHSPIVHGVTPVKVVTHTSHVVTKSPQKSKADLVAKIMAASKLSADAAREANEQAEIDRKRRIAELEADSEDEKMDEKYDDDEDGGLGALFRSKAEPIRRSVRLGSGSAGTPPPRKPVRLITSTSTELGNTFFKQAEKTHKKMFYLDQEKAVEEDAYPTPDSLLAVGEEDEDVSLDLDGMSDMAPGGIGIDGGLLADGKGGDEMRVVIWNGFWEGKEAVSNVALEQELLLLDETSPLGHVLVGAANAADISAFSTLLLSGICQPLFEEGQNIRPVCKWLYHTVINGDRDTSSSAANTLLTFLDALDLSRASTFGNSSNVLELLTSTLRSLGARARFTGPVTSLVASAVAASRGDACSFITRLVKTIATKDMIDEQDVLRLAEMMLVLAVDPSTSAALAYSAEEALDAIWPVWHEYHSAIAIASSLCGTISEYPLSLRVDMIHAVSRHTGLSRTIGRWMAMEMLVPGSLASIPTDAPLLVPSMQHITKGFEPVFAAFGEAKLDHHLNCDYISLISEVCSDIDGLVHAGVGRTAFSFDASEVNDVRNKITQAIKLLPSSLGRAGLQAENRSRLVHMKENIKILMVAAQMRNRRRDRVQKKGLMGGEGRGGQMRLSFGNKVLTT